MKKWEDLPKEIQNEKVRPYYDKLCHKTGSIVLKRIFDILVGLIILIIVLPFMLIIAVWMLVAMVLLGLTELTSVGILAGILAVYFYILYMCRDKMAKKFAFWIEKGASLNDRC